MQTYFVWILTLIWENNNSEILDILFTEYWEKEKLHKGQTIFLSAELYI